MAEIPGENSVPLGRSGTGAAFILGTNGTPNALTTLINGQRNVARAKLEQAKLRTRADEVAAKNYNDTVKFKQSGDPFFADGLEQQVYAPITGQLTEVFHKNRDDAFTRNALTRPILQRAENETVQAESKGKYLANTLAGYHGDKNLYDEAYAGTHLSATLRDGDRRRLPSEFDAEAWKDGLTGDHRLYKEPEVIRRATEKLAPIISQKIAETGQLGGQHTADQVRGRFVAFDGKGHTILNADGSPKLNLTADTDALLDADPLFKMKTDARESAYNAKREESIKANAADPSVPVPPVMSRRGHHAQMIGPLAFYDQSRDEGLNAQVPRPRAVAPPKPNQVVTTPIVSREQSAYRSTPGAPPATNHYAAVGRSFGSATKPYVEVEADNANMEVVGQNGEVTHLNRENVNGKVPMRLVSRSYVLYANGKRVGRSKPYETDREAFDDVIKRIKEAPDGKKLEVRVEGRGVVTDKANTDGDGLGAVRQPNGINKAGKPTYDTSTAETAHNVIVPMTQAMDEQLRRATNGEWSHYRQSAEEKAVTKALAGKGGRFVSPYSPGRPAETTEPKRTTPKPAFLKSKTAPAKQTTKPTPAADNSGGML